MIFEIQKDISLRTVAANDLNFEDLHLCGFLILELFLFDVSEQALFVGFQWLIIFILKSDVVYEAEDIEDAHSEIFDDGLNVRGKLHIS